MRALYAVVVLIMSFNDVAALKRVNAVVTVMVGQVFTHEVKIHHEGYCYPQKVLVLDAESDDRDLPNWLKVDEVNSVLHGLPLAKNVHVFSIFLLAGGVDQHVRVCDSYALKVVVLDEDKSLSSVLHNYLRGLNARGTFDTHASIEGEGFVTFQSCDQNKRAFVLSFVLASNRFLSPFELLKISRTLSSLLETPVTFHQVLPHGHAANMVSQLFSVSVLAASSYAFDEDHLHLYSFLWFLGCGDLYGRQHHVYRRSLDSDVERESGLTLCSWVLSSGFLSRHRREVFFGSVTAIIGTPLVTASPSPLASTSLLNLMSSSVSGYTKMLDFSSFSSTAVVSIQGNDSFSTGALVDASRDLSSMLYDKSSVLSVFSVPSPVRAISDADAATVLELISTFTVVHSVFLETSILSEPLSSASDQPKNSVPKISFQVVTLSPYFDSSNVIDRTIFCNTGALSCTSHTFISSSPSIHFQTWPPPSLLVFSSAVSVTFSGTFVGTLIVSWRSVNVSSFSSLSTLPSMSFDSHGSVVTGSPISDLTRDPTEPVISPSLQSSMPLLWSPEAKSSIQSSWSSFISNSWPFQSTLYAGDFSVGDSFVSFNSLFNSPTNTFFTLLSSTHMEGGIETSFVKSLPLSSFLEWPNSYCSSSSIARFSLPSLMSLVSTIRTSDGSISQSPPNSCLLLSCGTSIDGLSAMQSVAQLSVKQASSTFYSVLSMSTVRVIEPKFSTLASEYDLSSVFRSKGSSSHRDSVHSLWLQTMTSRTASVISLTQTVKFTSAFEQMQSSSSENVLHWHSSVRSPSFDPVNSSSAIIYASSVGASEASSLLSTLWKDLASPSFAAGVSCSSFISSSEFWTLLCSSTRNVDYSMMTSVSREVLCSTCSAFSHHGSSTSVLTFYGLASSLPLRSSTSSLIALESSAGSSVPGLASSTTSAIAHTAEHPSDSNSITSSAKRTLSDSLKTSLNSVRFSWLESTISGTYLLALQSTLVLSEAISSCHLPTSVAMTAISSLSILPPRSYNGVTCSRVFSSVSSESVINNSSVSIQISASFASSRVSVASAFHEPSGFQSIWFSDDSPVKSADYVYTQGPGHSLWRASSVGSFVATASTRQYLVSSTVETSLTLIGYSANTLKVTSASTNRAQFTRLTNQMVADSSYLEKISSTLKFASSVENSPSTSLSSAHVSDGPPDTLIASFSFSFRDSPGSNASVLMASTGSYSAAASGAVLTTPKPDSSPVVLNSIDVLSVAVGRLFLYTIPEATFYDGEDGSTRNLTLLCFDAAGTEFQSSWLLYNQSAQSFIGLPLRSDLSTQSKSGLEIVLKAYDRYGNYAVDVFRVVISSASEHVHFLITAAFAMDYVSFMRSKRQQIYLAQHLSQFYNDLSCASILVHNISYGSVAFTWSNASLSGPMCEKFKVDEILSLTFDSRGQPLPNFIAHMAPEYLLTSISWSYFGPCAAVPTVPLTASRAAVTEGNMFLSVVLPVVTVFVVLCVGISIVILLWRRNRVRHVGPDDKIFNKGRPVLLPDELELSHCLPNKIGAKTVRSCTRPFEKAVPDRVCVRLSNQDAMLRLMSSYNGPYIDEGESSLSSRVSDTNSSELSFNSEWQSVRTMSTRSPPPYVMPPLYRPPILACQSEL